MVCSHSLVSCPVTVESPSVTTKEMPVALAQQPKAHINIKMSQMPVSDLKCLPHFQKIILSCVVTPCFFLMAKAIVYGSDFAKGKSSYRKRENNMPISLLETKRAGVQSEDLSGV